MQRRKKNSFTANEPATRQSSMKNTGGIYNVLFALLCSSLVAPVHSNITSTLSIVSTSTWLVFRKHGCIWAYTAPIGKDLTISKIK